MREETLKHTKSMPRSSYAAMALAFALMTGSGAALARQTELFDAPRVIFVTEGGDAITLAQARSQIVRAALGLDWQVVKDEPGRIELHYDKQGKHQVSIEVLYDITGYDINYLQSTNLNFGERDGVRQIHPNYNRWIRNLTKRIGNPLAPAPKAANPSTQPKENLNVTQQENPDCPAGADCAGNRASTQ